MLDTNIISDIIKNPSGRAAQRARGLQGQLCTSIIVAAELRYGCAKRGSPELLQRVAAILNAMTVAALDTPADTEYGNIRAELEAAGKTIGGNDLLIAAHALREDATLVTANIREFARVRGLNVENWGE